MVDENDIKIFKTTIIYQYHRIIKIMWEKNCLVTPASFRGLLVEKMICSQVIINMIVKNF